MADEVAYLAAKYGMPTAIAVVAVACRLLFSSARWSLLGVVRGVLVGVFVGYLAGAYVYDLASMSDGEKGIAIAVSAILAEDLFVAVLSVGRRIRENPMAVFELIRGRKP